MERVGPLEFLWGCFSLCVFCPIIQPHRLLTVSSHLWLPQLVNPPKKIVHQPMNKYQESFKGNIVQHTGEKLHISHSFSVLNTNETGLCTSNNSYEWREVGLFASRNLKYELHMNLLLRTLILWLSISVRDNLFDTGDYI